MAVADILTGWMRVMGIMETPERLQVISNERMRICGDCERSKPSKFLDFLSNGPQNIEGLYCTECLCPCHQKSLSNDVCPLGKWE